MDPKIPSLKHAPISTSRSESELDPQRSPHFFDFPKRTEIKPTIGVCAMEHKARSRQMRDILDKLVADSGYKVIVFGDQTILNEDIENWPRCDFLIAFYSTDFPIEKAYEYAKRYKPFLLNSILLQHLLFDRRIVLDMLKMMGVETPRRLVAQRDGGPKLFKHAKEFIYKKYKVRLGESNKGENSVVEIIDVDTISIDGVQMKKPFVEKPVNAEDHNIYIYYPSDQGGGVRKLFRKVGNKSSKFYPDLWKIRTDGSYIYEEFVDANNSVDVKVYTLGSQYSYAETRKSPVVDGVVRRDSKGKEVRLVTKLNQKEQEFASLISKTFRQRICGFDMLRVGNKSMVIDINGWSFVKGNQDYYEKAASYLDSTFKKAVQNSWVSRFVDPNDKTELDPDYESKWVMKGLFSVCRHADRTPKQKSKWIVRSYKIVALLNGSRSEKVFRDRKDLEMVLNAVNESLLDLPLTEIRGDLESIKDTLERKINLLGTKVQLKPKFTKSTGEVFDVQMVIKWGGEITHAGLLQTLDLAENVKKDLKLLNHKLLNDVKAYRSSERRVGATCNVFCKVFCSHLANNNNDSELNVYGIDLENTSGPELDPEISKLIEIRAEMLDDSAAAKDEIENAKTHLRNFFNFRGSITKNPYYSSEMRLPKVMGDNPREFIKSIGYLLDKLVSNMHKNFDLLDDEKIKMLQPEWCCFETPKLFKERWEKMLADFKLETFDDVIFEPSKIGELYDSLKYDALHSRIFLECILSSDNLGSTVLGITRSISPSKSSKIPAPKNALQSSPSTSENSLSLQLETNNFDNIDALDPKDTKKSNLSETNPVFILDDSDCESDKEKTGTAYQSDIDIKISNSTELKIKVDEALDNENADNDIKKWLFGNQLQHQKELHELYHKSKALFDFVTPREYGISSAQKQLIGIQASGLLLEELIKDLEDVIEKKTSRSRFYFTKESHLHTLLNIVYESQLPTIIPFHKIGELDYLTHITFEVYERKKDEFHSSINEFSLRLGFSTGSSTKNLMDTQIDSSHALSVSHRINFTDHIPLEEAINLFKGLLSSYKNRKKNEV
ncbi:hypothetical protein BB559_003086 [Furculomyces boomerangus]|uniref:Inositol hexakisphosphate and diphosphoinositol-pentakisphosphate kinase n=1 Tax=Furculomyces boomerangus TaxID=61424 RepID=A0A2T9YP43_9FUNG|nr:hypothetical protein BB559_003086 [Furculomyces boomerangus]